jgi:class 3 adenylate cyclase
MEVLPEDRQARRLLEGLAQLGRLVVFDKRGIGMSDPYTEWDRPAIDQWSDDLIAVIEATELDRPLVFAWDLLGVGRHTAARRPDLVGQLVVFNPVALTDPGLMSDVAERIERQIHDSESGLDLIAFTSRTDEPGFRDWLERAGRLGASPTTASRLWQEMFATDTSAIGEVTVPTLVLHRVDSMVPRDSGARLVETIAGAVLVELPGTDLYPISGDVDAVVAELASFATGSVQLPAPERIVAALLFTDLVASTEHAADLGDERWRSLLDHHDAVVRRAVSRFGGRVVKYTGDGVLAVLPSATGALRAAEIIRSECETDGLEMRAGVHVGELDQRGGDVSGLAVNIAARIMSEGGSCEVHVSESVRLAAIGSGAEFDQTRQTELKGVPGRRVVHRWVGGT